MSRTRDELYFAPGVRFADLDFDHGALPSQFGQRITGYYLEPALRLADEGYAFPAGLLVVCAMDALAKFMTGASSDCIRSLCRNIPDLATDERAHIFIESFRNGLVHQALVKDGCEFSYDINCVAVLNHGRLSVNPKFLARSVQVLLDDYVQQLNRTPADKAALARKIKSKFRYELTH